jgi:hypothetical protein
MYMSIPLRVLRAKLQKFWRSSWWLSVFMLYFTGVSMVPIYYVSFSVLDLLCLIASMIKNMVIDKIVARK